MWPHLGRLSVRHIPGTPIECGCLVAWMTDRGKRLNVGFTLALPYDQATRLESQKGADEDVRKMKETVRFERPRNQMGGKSCQIVADRKGNRCHCLAMGVTFEQPESTLALA